MSDIRAASLRAAFHAISAVMAKNRDYLVELDARNGDGDLGISMEAGYRAVSDYLDTCEETDLGRVFMKCSKVFNEASPSTLGTITSFGLMGMAKALKGSESMDVHGLAGAMKAGVQLIMEKGGSRPGEKTVLDALCPAIEAFENTAQLGGDVKAAFEKAAEAAAAGSESTREMRPVHGRAAYYGDKGVGVLDGGAVAGRLIFEGILKVFEA